MDDTLPTPVPGPVLADRRKTSGVKQVDLAERIGVTRITLHRWEGLAKVDPIRASKYERALRELVTEAVA